MSLPLNELSWASSQAAVDTFNQSLSTRDTLEVPRVFSNESLIPDADPMGAIPEAKPLNFSEFANRVAQKVGASQVHLERLESVLNQEHLTGSDYLAAQYEMMNLTLHNEMVGRIGSGAVTSVQTLFKNQ